MLKKKNKQFILLLIVEFLLCLALLPGCFRKENLIASFNSNDIAGQLSQNEEWQQFKSERMELSPGVYKIKVQTALINEQQIVIELKCDSSYFKALRGNAITTFSGNSFWDFNVYLTDTVSSAYIQCDFYGTEANGLEKLQIYKTNSGFWMLLFTMILFWVVLDFIVVLHNNIKEEKVTKKQQFIFCSLTATIILSYFPFLTDYFFFGEDTIFYLNQMEDARISLLFCIPQLMVRLGFPIMTSYKMFVLTINVFTAITTYMLFEKCVASEYAALFGSSIYQLAIYRLLTLYEDASLGRACMMIFIPFAYCGIYLLCKSNRVSKEYLRDSCLVLLGILGMLQCYLLSAEFHILDVLWMLVLISVSLLIAIAFKRIGTRGNRLLKIALSTLMLINVFSSVYYTNGLVFCSTPVYLYSIENLGMVGAAHIPEMSYQSIMLLRIAEVSSLFLFVILMGIFFIQKRKRTNGK